jgi:(p)ppGpp synthase/HD superfamily hydrolase
MVKGTKDPQVARWYAIAKHGDQMYGQQPYVYHLDDSVHELVTHVIDLPALRYYDHDVIICAQYLHDVIEDTETTREDLDELFDPRIGVLVQAVSDGPGRNRKERKAGVYQAIRDTGPAALAVKLGDRLGNAKTAGLVKGTSDLLQMYRKEQVTFEQELRWSENGQGGIFKLNLEGFDPAFTKIREYLGIA